MSQQTYSFEMIYQTLTRDWRLEDFIIKDWQVLARGSFDQFRSGLLGTQEYAAFLIRALLGDHPDRKNKSGVNGEKQWSLTWIDNKIEISKAEERERLLRAGEQEQELIGADLTARTALTLAWQICQSTQMAFYPELDIHKHPQGNGLVSRLRFHSADFIYGDIKPVFVQENGNVFEKMPVPPTNGYFDGIYYKIDFDEVMKNHGWRTSAEHGFSNDPYNIENNSVGEPSSTSSDLKKPNIETFLGYPSFYQHDALKVIFCCHLENSYQILEHKFTDITKMDPFAGNLLEKGIKPYCKIKNEEYNSYKDGSSSGGGVVFCLGVAPQASAHFEPEKVNSTYGVFFTIEFVGVPPANGINFEKICEDLEGIRFRLQYKILQVQTARLLREAEAKNQKLRKYESMYNQLLRPLRNLTEAVRNSQEEAHELTATIYDPLDVFLGRQPEISKLFNEGDTHKGLFNITIKHKSRDYSEEEKFALGAEFLYLLMPSCLNDTIKTGLLSKEENDLKQAQRIFILASNWYHNQVVDPTQPYHSLSRAFLNFVGNNHFNEITPENLIEKVKAQFFTLYKPDKAYKAISWITMKSYLRTIAYNGEFLLIAEEQSLNSPQNKVVAESANPFNTQGHIIDFVGRVVAQHYSHHKGKTSVSCSLMKQNGQTCFVLNSKKNWFQSGEIWEYIEFVSQLLEHRDDQVRMVKDVGDRKRPFVDMFERIPPTLQPVINDNPHSLQFCIGKVSFEFCERDFKITSNG
jgi:hypothetical protein